MNMCLQEELNSKRMICKRCTCSRSSIPTGRLLLSAIIHCMYQATKQWWCCWWWRWWCPTNKSEDCVFRQQFQWLAKGLQTTYVRTLWNIQSAYLPILPKARKKEHCRCSKNLQLTLPAVDSCKNNSFINFNFDDTPVCLSLDLLFLLSSKESSIVDSTSQLQQKVKHVLLLLQSLLLRSELER